MKGLRRDGVTILFDDRFTSVGYEKSRVSSHHYPGPSHIVIVQSVAAIPITSLNGPITDNTICELPVFSL